MSMIMVKFFMQQHHCGKQGFVTLITVLIFGAIGIAIVVSLLLIGLSSSRTSFALEQSKQARVLTDACVEQALQQIRDSTPFTGDGSLTLGQGVCNYTVTSQGGQNRTILALGSVSGIIRKTKVVINKINPKIIIVSWTETSDF